MGSLVNLQDNWHDLRGYIDHAGVQPPVGPAGGDGRPIFFTIANFSCHNGVVYGVISMGHCAASCVGCFRSPTHRRIRPFRHKSHDPTAGHIRVLSGRLAALFQH
jgi:hypothetical protein